MKIYVGIDLGSTTTKAVVLTEGEEILARGITNSRNNYDVACALAHSEAITNARFALLRRRIAATPYLAAAGERLVARLWSAFRREQHERQLDGLQAACERVAADESERAALAEVFTGMRGMTVDLFADDGSENANSSDFFRDLASSQYLRLAEAVGKAGRVRFDRLMGVFDKSIHVVENAPPDLTFESNIRAALDRALERGLADLLGGAAEEDAARSGVVACVEAATATQLEEVSSVGTGYGRVRLPFPKERIRSEILCHGLGAHYFFPKTATVLDIGGQDTKAIQVDESGIVTSFQMNDRCAAGCGRYLGYIADEMNLGLHQLGPLACEAKRTVRINSTCTVFAGAELRERLSLGEKREDIL
ncbi:MAG: BadF/BadG/BcrA/BcrD ATPase family protein, partial [Acidobacteriota bacterium]